MNYLKLLQERREARNGIHAQMQKLVDGAAEEKRELTGEEKGQFEKMSADYKTESEEMRRYQTLIDQENTQRNAPPPRVVEVPGGNGGGGSELRNSTPEYRQAFFDYTRQGRNSSELRALVAGTPSLGGYTVPVGFEKELLKYLTEVNVMRRICEVRDLGFGETVIPIAESYGEATWLGEGDKYTETDDTFGQISLKAHKIGRIIKVSEELLADSAFDIEAELLFGFGQSFGIAEEKAFISGTGTGQPKGFLTDIVLKNSLIAGAVGYDDVVRLKYAVTAPYRKDAIWLLSDEAGMYLSLLKDGDGRPIWQPSIQVGTPDILLGRPVEYSAQMPAFETGKTSISFGNFKKYRIADRSGMSILHLDQLYAENGMVGYRGRRRMDGKLLDKKAIVGLKIR